MRIDDELDDLRKRVNALERQLLPKRPLPKIVWQLMLNEVKVTGESINEIRARWFA